MAIQIAGFATSNKRPGFFGETVYGAGAASAATIALVLLLVGMKTSAGSATANVDVLDVGSEDEAITYFGTGSQLHRQSAMALLEQGVKIKAAAVAEPAGAAATATLTIGGAWTTTGDLKLYLDGEEVAVGFTLVENTPTLAAGAVVAAVNANARLPVTAANVAGVVTFTRKNLGASGNDGALFQDKTKIPSGMTAVVAGGTAMAGGGVHFTAGSGTEDVTTLLSVLFPDWFDIIAVAQNDATNAARWELHVNNAAGVLEGRLQHLVFASNGSLSNAITIAQSTLNAERAQWLWQLDGENHPSEVAARFAARRTAVESVDPNAAYDGFVLTGIKPTRSRLSWPSGTTVVSALDNGVTPLSTLSTGEVVVERSITTKSRTGSNPDYRTLDTSDARMPDHVRRRLQVEYLLNVKPGNPRVAADLPDNLERPAGVLTPSRWNDVVKRILKDEEEATNLIDVDANPPVSEYNVAGKRIMSIVPVKAAPNNHSIGTSVRGIT